MSDCFDTIPNCKEYTTIVCGQYAPWSQEHCARFCNMCGMYIKTLYVNARQYPNDNINYTVTYCYVDINIFHYLVTFVLSMSTVPLYMYL